MVAVRRSNPLLALRFRYTVTDPRRTQRITGPFARLFTNAKDRIAFSKTEESREIDQLIDSLPEPPVGPQRPRNRPSKAGRVDRSPASTASGSPGAMVFEYGDIAAP